MVRFDAYTATMKGASVDHLLNLVARRKDDVVRGRGFHGFGTRLSVRDESGDEVSAIQFGGKDKERVMFEVKGERSPDAVQALREAVPEHRCTRVDSCVDFDEKGAWGRLLGVMKDVKRTHRLYGEMRGDPDFPEKGLTQYLGAASSAVRARCYEKGKQEHMHYLNVPDLVRVEIQVRPSKDAKTTFSRLSAMEVWGASAWTRDLAAQVLQSEVKRSPAGSVYKQTQQERALTWMCRQYGTTLLGLLDDVGDWACVGKTLGEYVKREQERSK
jgi:DNA relaxase NicK